MIKGEGRGYFFFFFFFKQKTAFELLAWLEFRRVLFRSYYCFSAIIHGNKTGFGKALIRSFMCFLLFYLEEKSNGLWSTCFCLRFFFFNFYFIMTHSTQYFWKAAYFPLTINLCCAAIIFNIKQARVTFQAKINSV